MWATSNTLMTKEEASQSHGMSPSPVRIGPESLNMANASPVLIKL